MILFGGDFCWEELGNGLSLLSYVESCMSVFPRVSIFFFNPRAASSMCSFNHDFDSESDLVFMTPSVTSLPSALVQTSLYILTFTFLLGGYFKNGITEPERI